MANPSDVEARLAALETRMEEVAADAAAARHLAAASTPGNPAARRGWAVAW